LIEREDRKIGGEIKKKERDERDSRSRWINE
jgi:hypothetical protein